MNKDMKMFWGKQAKRSSTNAEASQWEYMVGASEKDLLLCAGMGIENRKTQVQNKDQKRNID